MVLELDTSLFDIIGNISSNQLILLTLVLSDNQRKYQTIHEFLSRISEIEIQELINRKLISSTGEGDSIVFEPTEELIQLTTPTKAYFDQFYELYPAYVERPDGTRGYLRANINKCRKEYNRCVGKAKILHDHIMDCLKFDIDNKMMTGKIGYMKTMWNWLTQKEWEAVEEQMKYEQVIEPVKRVSYGTDVF